jgi:hypothetical protein
MMPTGLVTFRRRRSWRRVLGSCLLLAGCVPRERAAADENKAEEPPQREVLAAAPKPEAPAEPVPSADLDPESPGGSPEPETSDPLLVNVFSDDFQRQGANAGLGPDWRVTSGAWKIDAGRLCGENARNHPVWLARRLPTNAVIEFDAMSGSEEGDIKAEFWGDGRSSASGQSYTDATSYLTIFGGWKNRFHVLARRDEHARDRREIKLEPGAADLKVSPVVPERVYRFRVERRDGRTLRWQVDDMDILTYRDDEPLTGPGHEHLGFNDWQVRLCFDNLRVTPLKD